MSVVPERFIESKNDFPSYGPGEKAWCAVVLSFNSSENRGCYLNLSSTIFNTCCKKFSKRKASRGSPQVPGFRSKFIEINGEAVLLAYAKGYRYVE